MMSTKITRGWWSLIFASASNPSSARMTSKPAWRRNISALRRIVLLSSMTRTLLTIANCACFGGGLRISSASSPDDGVLEQVVIGRLGLVRALLALGRLSAGTHVGMRGVSVTPVREALLIENGVGRMLVEADGQEFMAAGALTVEILPGALELLR